MIKFKNILALLPIILLFLLAGSAFAQNGISNFAEGLPALKVESNGDAETTYSLSLQILALMTGLTLLPSIVLGATSFTRIIIVLSLLRQAMGTQQTPPNQVLIAIALFLTFFIRKAKIVSHSHSFIMSGIRYYWHLHAYIASEINTFI